MAYPNGLIPYEEMDPVPAANGQTAWLLPGAAAAFLRAREKYRSQYGRELCVTSAGDGFRSYDRQRNVFLERYSTRWSRVYQRGRGWIVDRRDWDDDGNGVKTPYYRHTSAAAAVPGTSNHGRGITVDVWMAPWFGTQTYRELAAVMESEGFSNDEGSRIGEPWHWNYTRDAELVHDTNRIPDVHIEPIDGDLPAPLIPEEEDDMTTRISYNGGHFLVNVSQGLLWGIPNPETTVVLSKTHEGLPITELSLREFQVLRQTTAACGERIRPGFKAVFLPDETITYIKR